ncbi:probable carboxylesterase 2 [Euphorbia lathyris]|uniref:probable carboxylesterase 2 n=1 Tax=Euphorbia lathyris TaxID=212925 RepID=UPI00331319A3
MENKEEISRIIFPYIQIHKDGTIERLAGTGITLAGLDPETNVLSKDTIITPQTRVSARFYLPNSIKTHEKIPLVIYYHGGGFFLSSTADPFYHHSLNKIVAEARVLLVSINYRLAPETPLPAAYEDSWTALNWIAQRQDSWLINHADFNKVFLAGDSCGANMAHHFGARLGKDNDNFGIKIEGIAMIHPYFWGKDPIGVEVSDEVRKSMVDDWWLFVCPSEKGLDDPMINPFVDETVSLSELEGLGCERVMVVVAEKDILRDRGRFYYEKLVKSGWGGSAEIVEIQGEDHIFHIFDPNSDKAKSLFKTLASFFNKP